MTYIGWGTRRNRELTSSVWNIVEVFKDVLYRTICIPSSRPLKVKVSYLHPLSLCIIETFPLFFLLPFKSKCSRIVVKFIILDNVETIPFTSKLKIYLKIHWYEIFNISYKIDKFS